MQTLEKRTADNRLFDVDCTLLLDTPETITAITAITADHGGLTFSGQAVNSATLTYPNGRQALPGKVVQVYISGGTIPVGSTFLLCTVRVLMVTTVNPAIEATVLLKLTNTISS